MKLQLWSIGEVIFQSIVKRKVLSILALHAYFPMNTKERHFMSVLKGCLENKILTFGVQRNYTMIINPTTGDAVVTIVPGQH